MPGLPGQETPHVKQAAGSGPRLEGRGRPNHRFGWAPLPRHFQPVQAQAAPPGL